ncbi:Elongation factor Ts [Gemmatirosa kalamazoonensis]|uniref:Elongation factor Ts n=1 Tax=Gemmatirosa kalamazoonensis TaxID=861299 RepID=W0RNC2_9BACT|nr:translation elongation factor Ts [Gemmatirosa kalamazoonensis]AHG90948.1 Elongation factor Ts [Gemmatirosa kalamazoonensis]
MATITAKDVSELRQRTGAGMMDCKKALEESGGDMSAAVDLLRKKGIAKAEKRTGRTASEGAVAVAISDDATTGAMVEVNTETDFVARNEEFQSLVRTLAQHALNTTATTDAASLLAAPAHDGSGSTEEYVKGVAGKTGEAVSLRKAARFQAKSGVVGSYVHFNGKIGVLVEVDAPDAASRREELVSLAKQLAEHIAAAAPVGVDKESVPQDVIDRERAIFVEQVRAEGKPEAMIEKIVEGKIQAFYKDVALTHQVWVRDPKVVVGDLVKKANATVKRFARFQLGAE